MACLASISTGRKKEFANHPEKALVQRITGGMSARLEVLLDLGLGYLTPEQHADAVARRNSAP